MNNKYEIFISHASEDKDILARPLTRELLRKGYNVFLDEISIAWGESISESINKGLSQSEYCIVIISPVFLSKQWTRAELQSITNLFVSAGKKLLPIWHKVSYEDISKNVPLLIDVKAMDSSIGVPKLSEHVQKIVGSPKGTSITNYLWNFYDFSPELQNSILRNFRYFYEDARVDLMKYHSVLEELDIFLDTIEPDKLSIPVQETLSVAKKELENAIVTDINDLLNDR